jgi:TolB protein
MQEFLIWLRRAVLWGLIGLWSPLALAQLAIEITGAGAFRVPVSIAAFAGDPLPAGQLVSVVRADLERSGLFRHVDAGIEPVPETAPPAYDAWKSRGADAFVAGSVVSRSDGRIEVRFRVYDTNRRVALGGVAFVASPETLRLTAHRVADYIYERLLGEPGVFSTRIAYIVKRADRWELQIADADGFGAQTALSSREPIISPAWSPDGKSLAYVSFEEKKPVVYIHTLATGQRRVLANFKGSNSSPAWAPDGKRLAIVLTREGGSQMFLINADGSGLTRLASSPGIDTEPFFSPDGSQIYFTSDRGGSPQIYRIPAAGGAAARVTFDGNYNVTPRLSPDGKTLAFVTRRDDGSFRLASMDLATRQTQILTDSLKDESPSFAPNGRMIVIATEIGGRGVLAAVSTDGRIKQRLSTTAGDVREPAWSPFAR